MRKIILMICSILLASSFQLTYGGLFDQEYEQWNSQMQAYLNEHGYEDMYVQGYAKWKEQYLLNVVLVRKDGEDLRVGFSFPKNNEDPITILATETETEDWKSFLGDRVLFYHAFPTIEDMFTKRYMFEKDDKRISYKETGLSINDKERVFKKLFFELVREGDLIKQGYVGRAIAQIKGPYLPSDNNSIIYNVLILNEWSVQKLFNITGESKKESSPITIRTCAVAHQERNETHIHSIIIEKSDLEELGRIELEKPILHTPHRCVCPDKVLKKVQELYQNDPHFRANVQATMAGEPLCTPSGQKAGRFFKARSLWIGLGIGAAIAGVAALAYKLYSAQEEPAAQ